MRRHYLYIVVCIGTAKYMMNILSVYMQMTISVYVSMCLCVYVYMCICVYADDYMCLCVCRMERDVSNIKQIYGNMCICIHIISIYLAFTLLYLYIYIGDLPHGTRRQYHYHMSHMCPHMSHVSSYVPYVSATWNETSVSLLH